MLSCYDGIRSSCEGVILILERSHPAFHNPLPFSSLPEPNLGHSTQQWSITLLGMSFNNSAKHIFPSTTRQPEV
jgi:hypothetical protein